MRLKHLSPIPQGETLGEMAAALLGEVEAGWQAQVRRDGQDPLALWEEERQGLLPLPERPFEARQLVLTSASRKATVQVEGGLYSVSSTWAGLDVAAYVGVGDIRLVCRGEEQVVPRERPGGNLGQWHRRLRRADLLIIDELGFVPFDRGAGGELLFNLLSDRYETRSTAITSNLNFGEWVQVFGDEKLTTALLDRLGHHAHIQELFDLVQQTLGVFDATERPKALNSMYRRLRDENYELTLGFVNIPWAVGSRVLTWQPYPFAFYPSNLYGITLR